jgi:hypothetical protein
MMMQNRDFDTALLCFIVVEKGQHEDYAPTILKRIFALQNSKDFISIALYLLRMSLLCLIIFPQQPLEKHRRSIQAT